MSKVITGLVLLQVRLQVVPRGVVVNLADDDARATNDLDGGAFTVDLAETGPLAQGLVVTNLQDWDLVLDAQGLVETASKTITVLGVLEGLLDGSLDGVALGCDGGGWDGSGRFSIRHDCFLSSVRQSKSDSKMG